MCNRHLLNVRKNQGDPKIFPGAIKIFMVKEIDKVSHWYISKKH